MQIPFKVFPTGFLEKIVFGIPPIYCTEHFEKVRYTVTVKKHASIFAFRPADGVSAGRTQSGRLSISAPILRRSKARDDGPFGHSFRLCSFVPLD